MRLLVLFGTPDSKTGRCTAFPRAACRSASMPAALAAQCLELARRALITLSLGECCTRAAGRSKSTGARHTALDLIGQSRLRTRGLPFPTALRPLRRRVWRIIRELPTSSATSARRAPNGLRFSIARMVPVFSRPGGSRCSSGCTGAPGPCSPRIAAKGSRNSPTTGQFAAEWRSPSPTATGNESHRRRMQRSSTDVAPSISPSCSKALAPTAPHFRDEVQPSCTRSTPTAASSFSTARLRTRFFGTFRWPRRLPHRCTFAPAARVTAEASARAHPGFQPVNPHCRRREVNGPMCAGHWTNAEQVPPDPGNCRC